MVLLAADQGPSCSPNRCLWMVQQKQQQHVPNELLTRPRNKEVNHTRRRSLMISRSSLPSFPHTIGCASFKRKERLLPDMSQDQHNCNNWSTKTTYENIQFFAQVLMYFWFKQSSTLVTPVLSQITLGFLNVNISNSCFI